MNAGSILKYETRRNQACLPALINYYLAFSRTEGFFDPVFVKSLRDQATGLNNWSISQKPNMGEKAGKDEKRSKDISSSGIR